MIELKMSDAEFDALEADVAKATKPMLKGWTRFEPSSLIIDATPEEISQMAKAFEISEDEVRASYADLANDKVFVNSRYQVNVRHFASRGDGFPALIHLSIKRRDKDRVGEERYRDFLRIKNELVGPEHEAVELYPAMQRNVDTSNQYHLWVLAEPELRWPFGFGKGKMLEQVAGTNSRQHPFESGDKPQEEQT